MIRAYSINFPVETRTGPDSSNASDRSLTLDEPHFRFGIMGEPDCRVGVIEIDEAAGKFIIRSPYKSRTTGEPLVVVGSMNQVSYQPLTDSQARKYYPHEYADKQVQQKQARA